MNSANRMIKSLMCHNFRSHPLMVIQGKQITANESDDKMWFYCIAQMNWWRVARKFCGAHHLGSDMLDFINLEVKTKLFTE